MSRYATRPFIAFIICFTFFLSVYPSILAASASITLSPTSGPPTTEVKIKGSDFGVKEVVDLIFDSMVLGTTKTNKNGSFSGKIIIPASALPGNHIIEATGQTSGLSAQAIFFVQTDWNMFGFNPHHSFSNPYENVLSSSNVSNLTLDWKVPMTGYSSIDSSAAVVNGTVYVMPSTGPLYSFNAYTGMYTGAFNLPPTGGSSPAIVNGMIYIGASWSLYAINISTDTTWSFPTGGQVDSSPVVANGIVYFGSQDHNLYAVNAVTGSLLWSAATGGQVNSSPAVNKGVVYVGSEDGNLYAFNAASGTLLWKAATGGTIGSSPAVANGQVYIGVYSYGSSYGLYAYKASTGVLRWKAATGPITSSSPSVVNGVVYVGTDNNILYAVSATTGQVLWDTFGIGGYSIADPPTVANRVVFVGSQDNNLYALDAASGKVLWTYTTGGFVGVSPVVVNGIIYAGSGDGYFYTFHLPGTSF